MPDYTWRGVVRRPGNTRQLRPGLADRRQGVVPRCLLGQSGVTADDRRDLLDPAGNVFQRTVDNLCASGVRKRCPAVDGGAGR